MIKSRTHIATPPGATIKEQLIDRNISQKEFACRMDMSEKHISKLINGEVQLTTDVAVRLEMVLGLPAHFWSNLESIFREKLVKIQIENSMDDDLEILRKIPYNDMVKNGWVESERQLRQRVYNCRKFFEVVNLGLLKDTPISMRIVCRKLGNGEKSDYALLACAQKAKLEARNLQIKPINIDKLKKSLTEIRKMTLRHPSVFISELHHLLAQCGIAIIFLPHVNGSFLHGVTFYDGNKIVIGMTMRGKDTDRFWFSLFHEIGHIVLGHLAMTNGTTDEDENKADEFARDTLIPLSDFNDFVAKKSLDQSSICEFAKSIGIDASIVVGRLQKEHYIPFNRFNDLKTQVDITS